MNLHHVILGLTDIGRAEEGGGEGEGEGKGEQES